MSTALKLEILFDCHARIRKGYATTIRVIEQGSNRDAYRFSTEKLRYYCIRIVADDLSTTTDYGYNPAVDELGFSACAYDKVLRVVRTLADLDGADAIAVPRIPKGFGTGHRTGS